MDGQLDIFGQQPFINMNTQLCFAFTISSTASHTRLTEILSNGLTRLYASFPWLACEVVIEGSGEGNSGVFKFNTVKQPPEIFVRDLRDGTSMATMEELKQANFPMSMMDEDTFSPRKAFARAGSSKPAPVFLIQANFVTGGLVLTFLAQHNTIDMTGQAAIIRLFSKACRDEHFTDEEIRHGNAPRKDIVPLLDSSYTPGPELQRHIVKTRPSTDPPFHTSPTYTWAYFAFSSSALAALKALASVRIAPPAYVSTDDALTALFWQSVLRARQPRLDPTASSTIARAVDVRPHLNISPMYPGPIQICEYTTFTVESLVEHHLSDVAAQLRAAISSDVEFHARAVATYLSRTPDKFTFSSTANLDLAADVILSSWARVQAFDLDFGLGLGGPEAVRRPQFQAVEGLVFFMPKTRDDEIPVAVCLREEDMERLKRDEEFARYGMFVG